MPEGFTEPELRELADLYPPGVATSVLFLAAGFSNADLPPDSAAETRLAWWNAVNRRIAAGALPEARHRLLAVVCKTYPGNKVLCLHQPPARWRLLFMGASPRSTEPIRADRELKRIMDADVDVTAVPAATVRDLNKVLVDPRPDILHLSCHASGTTLIFEDGLGGPHALDAAREAQSLRLFQDSMRLRLRGIVLNACRSELAAERFRGLADIVVAHRDELPIEDAIDFAGELYAQLANGQRHPLDRAARIAMDLITRGIEARQPLKDGLVIIKGAR